MKFRAGKLAGGRRGWRWSWGIAVALCGFLTFGATMAIADIPDGNTINACRNNTTFVIRVIDKTFPAQVCTAGETALSWTNWKWRATYLSTVQYNVGDVVLYAGSSYLVRVKPPTTGVAPTTTAY